MKKKLLALVLVVSMVISLPGLALANENVEDVKTDEVLEEINREKEELLEIKDTLEDNEEMLQITDETLDALNEFESNVEHDFRSYSSNYYELDSIQTRAELFVEIVEAITVSTTELRDKTVSIHNKIGFEITKATIAAVNPLTSVKTLEDYRISLKNLIEDAKASRDILASDIATIYVKERLSKEIWQTRFARDKEILGKVPFEVYNELNRNITKAVGVQLNPKSTVEEIDLEIINLQRAFQTALDQR